MERVPCILLVRRLVLTLIFSLRIGQHSPPTLSIVDSEFWGEHNLYCPNCSSPKLTRQTHNTKVIDFCCPVCEFKYQLKGQKSPIGSSISDGAYESMMAAIRRDDTPNFYFLHYDLATWSVKNLLLIPHFAFPPSAIVKRNPTTPKGRSKPWVGCNISLNRIPVDARISIVAETQIVPETEVREKFRRVRPLQEIPISKRGWMLEVLNVVHRLGKTEFTNQDVYAFEGHFRELYPNNHFIRHKIRQQLQDLAKAGFLIHAGRNDYRVK